MRRRVVILAAAVLVGVVALVATLPFWIAPVAARLGRARGLTFGEYERIGYARFAVRDVEFRRDNVRVTVSRVETETPVLWLWHGWTGAPAEVIAGTWRVEVDRSTESRVPNPDRGWVMLRRRLQKIAAQLDRWPGRARTGAGTVRWPQGEISVDSAEWATGKLNANGLAYRAIKADAVLRFANAADELRLTARTADQMADVTLVSHGASIEGNIALWEQPATLSARFSTHGWRPVEATLRAQNWNVPAERVGLAQRYARVRGSAEIAWGDDRFAADITAASDPLPDRAAPPLEVAINGQGDTAAFTVERFNATLPGITAQLSEPVTVERSGKLRESAARFALQADLAQQPWFLATGIVEGEARLISGVAESPVVEFSVSSRDVLAHDVALSAVDARGRFAWPQVQVESATITGADGEQLELRGGWDLRAKEIFDARVEGRIHRRSIARWLPEQPEFDALTIVVQANGPIAQVRHEGRASIANVNARGLKPVAIEASWRGTGATLSQFDAVAAAGATKLAVTGSLSAESVQLTRLDLTQGDARRLELKQPALVRWRPQPQVQSLHLAGPEGSITVDATLGEAGQVQLSAREISSSWLTDLVPAQGPAWQLTLLALIGKWDRGPMEFSLSAGASVDMGEGRSAAVIAAARGDHEGVRVEALRATEGDDTVVNATGHMPVTFAPGRSPLMHIDPDGALSLDATVSPHAAFWEKLATMSGISLVEPEAAARLRGTWQRPEGNATLRAAKITVDPERVKRPLPAIEALDVSVRGDPRGVILDTFSLRVEGQVVRAEGRLPVPDGKWSTLFKEPLATARRGADLRVEVPDADVAVFRRFLPEVLAPKGRLQADLQYKSGGVEGYLKLRDAASRPLGPLGVLQEINADIALSGRKLALRGVTARSGGQPVTLTGTVELPLNGQPQFDLALRGENLPFVRQTGLLLRGDIDLKLQTPRGGVPHLSGQVRLRDSLFLSDVRAFIPRGGAASPTRRPPYFAIETPPVNAWTIAVEVVGEEFMRLRTPVFVGVASARFRLNGTLGEPRAIGEALLDEGRVRMPFASFEIVQGSVRLTEADSLEPAIYLRGKARRWGYDLTMEIEGDASQPNVVFTSSPPLDSEQVLLMVMTGAAPSNEINKSGSERMASIGYFLGQSLLASLGSDPAEAERWGFSTGEKISRDGEETYEVFYQLSDRWTLTGEYNEFDEYVVGAKWRIFRGEAEKAAEERDNAKR